MIIKLMPQQVPALWEAIKLAAVQSNEISGAAITPFLHRLLQTLLSEKAQCFVRLDDARTLLSLMITSIIVNPFTGQRELVVRCFYSFRMMTEEDTREGTMLLKEFAKTQECDLVSSQSRHPRIWQLAQDHGWREHSRRYIYEVTGSGQHER